MCWPQCGSGTSAGVTQPNTPVRHLFQAQTAEQSSQCQVPGPQCFSSTLTLAVSNIQQQPSFSAGGEDNAICLQLPWLPSLLQSLLLWACPGPVNALMHGPCTLSQHREPSSKNQSMIPTTVSMVSSLPASLLGSKNMLPGSPTHHFLLITECSFYELGQHFMP